jgi:hypothetical protein
MRAGNNRRKIVEKSYKNRRRIVETFGECRPRMPRIKARRRGHSYILCERTEQG